MWYEYKKTGKFNVNWSYSSFTAYEYKQKCHNYYLSDFFFFERRVFSYDFNKPL